MDCKHRRRLRASGCKRCGLYRCPECRELRPWSNGGTDSPVCDECWMKANPRPAKDELATDDSSDEHTMGVQGYDCTAEEGRALLADAVAKGGAALRKAIGPDDAVGIGL